MISIYSVTAVFFMIIAIGAMYRNFTSRSPFYLDFFGEKYARNGKAVKGIFEKLELGAGGGSWIICHVGKETEVRLPNTHAMNNDFIGKEIHLALVKDVDFDVYIQQTTYGDEKCFANCVIMEPEKIAQQNKKAQGIFLSAVMGCCIGFACLQSIPFLSCILFLASTTVFALFKPLLDWKKYVECCKIYTKKAEETNISVNDLKQSAFPPDFNYWSQAQKDLYSIAVRLESEQKTDRDKSELGDDSPPIERRADNIEQPDVDRQAHSEKQSVYAKIAPKACENCGCIIDNDNYYCPNCGALQKKTATFHENWKDVKKTKNRANEVFYQHTNAEKAMSAKKIDGDMDNTVFKDTQEDAQKSNTPKHGKKSKNRRHRPNVDSNGTDVNKMIQSLESPSQLIL